MSIAATDISGGSGGSMNALELLADPEKLKQRIKSFNDAEANANAVIALAGPASEIVQMREEIDGKLTDAKKALETAHDTADGIVNKAESDADKIVADAQLEAEGIVDKIKERAAKTEEAHQEAQSKLSQANAELEHLDQREKALTQEREELQKYEEGLDARDTQLLQEKSKLATVRETIEQALG